MLRLKTPYLRWRLRHWQDQLAVRTGRLLEVADYLMHVEQMAPRPGSHWKALADHGIRICEAEIQRFKAWRYIHEAEGKIERIQADLKKHTRQPVNSLT